jgi:hypothetical protein
MFGFIVVGAPDPAVGVPVIGVGAIEPAVGVPVMGVGVPVMGVGVPVMGVGVPTIPVEPAIGRPTTGGVIVPGFGVSLPLSAPELHPMAAIANSVLTDCHLLRIRIALPSAAPRSHLSDRIACDPPTASINAEVCAKRQLEF